MTRCNDYKILMNKLLDREISPAERAELEGHSKLCRNCAREFKAIQSGLTMLISMSIPEPTPEFTSETVTKAFRAKKEKLRRQKLVSCCLLFLTLTISSLLMVFEPAIQRFLFSFVLGLAQCGAILPVLSTIVSTMTSALLVFGDVIYGIVCGGYNPGFIYLTAMIVMIFIAFMSKVHSLAFLFNRR